MIEADFESGMQPELNDGQAERAGGFIDCPICFEDALYYEEEAGYQVCVSCWTEFPEREIVKPVITVTV